MLLALVASWSGCPGEDPGPVPLRARAGRAAVTLRGAGATFPYPIYSRWALIYFEKTGVRVRYQRRGSRGGIDAVKAGVADFGATDIPLSDKELAAHGLLQFPMVIGGVVPVYNLPGVAPGALRLSADVLACIYLGRITRWDDPALRKANPGIKLPGREIVPIQQPNTSGTSWLFRRYLSGARACQGGKERSHDAGVPARDNGQAVRFVRRFKHTLGYVEFSQAVKHRLSWARLLNGSNRYSVPSRAAFEAAVAHGSWSGDGLTVARLSSSASAKSWPITGASYVLVQQKQAQARKASQMLRFFHWALTAGAQAAKDLDYGTIPARQVETINRAWGKRIRAAGQPVWRGP